MDPKQIQTHVHKRRRKHKSAVGLVVAVVVAAVVVAVVAIVAVVTAAARGSGGGHRDHDRAVRTPVFASEFVEVCSGHGPTTITQSLNFVSKMQNLPKRPPSVCILHKL